MKDFSFQGEVSIGERLAGPRPGAMYSVGDMPKLELSITEEKEKRRESRSGRRFNSATLTKSREASLSGTLNWASARNLALGFGGEWEAVPAGTVTGEVFPDDLEVGARVALDHMDVSSVVITDAAGTPVELDEGVHYRIVSSKHGMVEMLDVTGLTQPFSAAYSYAASSRLAMLTETTGERYLILDGINTTDGAGDEPVRLRLYKVQFNLFSSLPLINESFGELPFTAEVLYDDEAAADPVLGGFGRLEKRPEA